MRLNKKTLARVSHEPVAFDEINIKDKFWQDEDWDCNMPSPGFITDFVLATRGIESPSKFSIWVAINMISSVLRRYAWIDWVPKALYSNFYVCLIAPPRICAKGTVINWGMRILGKYHTFISDPERHLEAIVRFIRNKATPEKLVIEMLPQVLRPKGNSRVQVDKGSQVSIVVPELATFLGKQTYNEGIIDLLTNLYDCEDEWTYSTKKEDVLRLRNVFVTFLGGTTADALSSSIPFSAFGGGFMSRMVAVVQDRPTRSRPKPLQVAGGPSDEELARRLAWIGQNVVGAYQLSEEADLAYCAWYDKFFLERIDFSNKQMARYDNILLKLALIIRASRYAEGRNIELQDYEDAKRLMEATYKDNKKVIEGVGAPQIVKLRSTIEGYLFKKKEVRRRTALMAGSNRWSVDQFDRVIDRLCQEDQVQILLNDKIRRRSVKDSKEVYKWVGHE